MELYFFRKINDPNIKCFHQIVLDHNVKTSKLIAAVVGMICLILFLINQFTNASHTLTYPDEYAAAITFIFIASWVCYFAFLISKKVTGEKRTRAYKFLTIFYALIIVISSLWITFVMQHNPSNNMAIFVLGILSVATLWIFREKEAMIIALLILIAFNSGLHYFQTEPCRLFTNYITGTCVTVFFVCISRVSFSVNYNHFKQLKKIEYHEQDILKVNEMQTEILAVVAHDLRRPISNVLQIADLLKNSEATVEERNEYYDMIFETCNRSNSIVEDLLDAARSDESHTTFVYTCMNDFMGHALVQFIKSNNHSHEILFVPPTMKIYAMINHQKMMRVFDNVFSNSLKFTAKNGRITVKLTGDEDNVCILVADNGIGIPNDLIPFLFSRFSKSGRTGLNGEKSNGLGLSICKLFLKQHHGDISATSEEGKGTQIKIVLPREVLHSN